MPKIEHAMKNLKLITLLKNPKTMSGILILTILIKKSLEAVASSWTNETTVVWKQLGEQFITSKNNEMTGNLGQVAKEYLKDEETKGFQFTFKGKNENKIRFRRALKRVSSTLSVPSDVCAKKVRLLLSEKICSGEIEIGNKIVERKYKKLALDENGDVVTHSFSVNGRKHSLRNLSVKLFKKTP